MIHPKNNPQVKKYNPTRTERTSFEQKAHEEQFNDHTRPEGPLLVEDLDIAETGTNTTLLVALIIYISIIVVSLITFFA